MDEWNVRYCLYADSAGVPDLNNYLWIEVKIDNAGTGGMSATNSMVCRTGQVVAGVEGFVPGSPARSVVTTNLNPFAYLGFRKVGGDYGVYISRGDGAYLDLGTNSCLAANTIPKKAFAPTIAHCGVRVSQTATRRTRARFGIDFFRFRDDANALPW
jgi:hypothetical protein